MSTGSLHIRRACALALMAAVLLGLTFAMRLALQTYDAQQREVLAQIQDRTDESLSLVAMKSVVETEFNAFTQTIDELGLTISAPSVQQGVAAVQSRIDAVVANGGGTIERIEAGDPKGGDNRSILPISVTYKAEAGRALEILAELENGNPRLFVTSLSLRALQLPDVRLAGKTMLTVDGQFDALMLRLER